MKIQRVADKLKLLPPHLSWWTRALLSLCVFGLPLGAEAMGCALGYVPSGVSGVPGAQRRGPAIADVRRLQLLAQYLAELEAPPADTEVDAGARAATEAAAEGGRAQPAAAVTSPSGRARHGGAGVARDARAGAVVAAGAVVKMGVVVALAGAGYGAHPPVATYKHGRSLDPFIYLARADS